MSQHPITRHTVHANTIRQHYLDAGSGSPVVLLHGFPETCYAWRRQVPALARRHRVIVPDLRGYGDTDKPPSGYDKRTMACDLRALLDELGIGRAALVGHDRGALVATRFAKDHPERIGRLAVLDAVPTLAIFERMDAAVARGHWLLVFNQVADLPEALIAGREEAWLRFILGGWTYDPEALTPEDIAAYVRAYSRPGALRGAMSDHRAASVDLAQDREDRTTRIGCPTLALWGECSELVGRMWDVAALWRELAPDLATVAVPRCGHLPHEERPETVNKALLEFLDGWKG